MRLDGLQMARGYKTGGRKPGSKNKRTLEIEQATEGAAEMIARALGLDAFEGDAHSFLMAVYKNLKIPVDLRVDAAKAAIRFEKPALGQIESKSEIIHRYVARLPEKAANTEQWQEQHTPTTH